MRNYFTTIKKSTRFWLSGFSSIFYWKIQVLLKVIFIQFYAFWASFLFFKKFRFWQSVFKHFFPLRNYFIPIKESKILTIIFLTIFYGKIQVVLKVIFRQFYAFWTSFLFFKNSRFWQSDFQAFSMEKHKLCSKWFLGNFMHSEQVLHFSKNLRFWQSVLVIFYGEKKSCAQNDF